MINIIITTKVTLMMIIIITAVLVIITVAVSITRIINNTHIGVHTELPNYCIQHLVPTRLALYLYLVCISQGLLLLQRKERHTWRAVT